ncbi:uncharacterized protein LOC134748694 [Cydia strobilella]|uniref:uncharacterized protein LOC134748694 n=1 Tax=Cydia strobilella TaxID=1100964 RepID=UPI00300791F2
MHDLEADSRQNTEGHEIAEPEVEQSAPMPDETAQASAETPVEPNLLMALGESTDDIPEFVDGKPLFPAGKLEGSTSLLLPEQQRWTRQPDEDGNAQEVVQLQHNSTGSETCPSDQASCSNSTVNQGPPPPACQPYPGCREALRAAFVKRGTPLEAVPLMLASLAQNTLSQYGVTIKLWWEYCTSKNIDVYHLAIPEVLSFLTELFNKGCSYGSLNSHRSALSLLLGSEIGTDNCVKRLLKGAFKLKPMTPKYKSTWDPQVVLNHVSSWYPNSDIPLEKITKKLVTLLALCTAHRVQTLSLIKLEHITEISDGIKIGIVDILKTSAVGREQPILNLPFFREKLSICPATTLKDYIFVTKNLRVGSTGTLFLTYKRPHKAASSQTLSRWIKQVLHESGVDVNVFGAHSTRHSATSTAFAAGISLDTIRKAAGWTSTSKTFAKFYNRPIINCNDDYDFARSIFFPETNVSDNEDS